MSGLIHVSPHGATIIRYITPYNDDWPGRFEQIAQFLRSYLPQNCGIHHVGSTSIPGMPAKDIIDLDIECPDGCITSIITALEKAGYTHEGDKGIPSREAFCPKPTSRPSELPQHHLYACEAGSSELFRHLAFRNYVILHPARAKWLATQKIAADQSAVSRAAYMESKANAYEIIVHEAISWVNKTNAPHAGGQTDLQR